MTSNKKMLALVIVIAMAIVAVTGTLIAVLVAGNQSAQSKVHVKYTSSDVNVRVEAKYYIGSTGTDMVDKSNGNATSIELDATKTTGSLDQNATEVTLDKTNSRIVYEYKFTNLSSSIPATIDQLLNADDNTIMIPSDVNNNVDITYMTSATQLGSNASSTSTTFNKQALPVSSTRYVYVMVAIHDLLTDVDFQGDFGWDLAKGTSASVDSTGSGNSIVNVNTSQTGFYNADAVSKIDLMVGVENVEPVVYPMVENKCFTGWYLDSGFNTKAVFPLQITETTKLYPKFETATSGLSYTYDSRLNTYSVGGYTDATNIIIADVYNNGTNTAKVTSIIAYAFDRSTNAVSVEIPKTITSIGDSAFMNCRSLAKITIPNSVSSIGEAIFYCCTALEKINVDVNNAIYSGDSNCLIEKATKSLIAGCKTSAIPNYVLSIAKNSFANCNTLTSITIPDSVLSICDYAFSYCEGLTSVVIGSGVNSIGLNAFQNCPALTSAKFAITTGWVAINTNPVQTRTPLTISSTNFSANATLLKTTYVEQYWNRA